MTNPLTEAILARLRTGRRAFGVYLIPGFPDWPTSIEAVRAATGAGVTFVEFPVITEPRWSPRTGPTVAGALGRALAQPDAGARRAWLAEVEIGVGIVYESAWPAPDDWRVPDEGAAGLLLEHNTDAPAAYAKIAAAHGTCLVPAVGTTTPDPPPPPSPSPSSGLSPGERETLAYGGGFVYLAMGARTGQIDAGAGQVAAKAAAIRAARPDLPVCCAFGLSRPEDVERVPQECDGVIVGSAALDSLSQGLDRFRGWLGDMLAAT